MHYMFFLPPIYNINIKIHQSKVLPVVLHVWVWILVCLPKGRI